MSDIRGRVTVEDLLELTGNVC